MTWGTLLYKIPESFHQNDSDNIIDPSNTNERSHMKPYAILVICLIFVASILGCAPDENKDPRSIDQGKRSSISSDEGKTNNAKQDQKDSVDIAIAKYRTSLVITIMQLFQHSVWVLGDEEEIGKTLKANDLNMVGSLIRGEDHPSSSKEVWGVESPPMSGGQSYVAVDDDNLFVIYRSTDAEDGWDLTLNVLTDLKAYYTDLDFLDDDPELANKFGALKVHSGFHKEYLRYRDQVLKKVQEHPNKRIHVSGHSLGGALASLTSLDIVAQTGRDVTLVTFGAPRVGNAAYQKLSDHLIPATYRVVINGDPIPRVPGSLLDYQHSGKVLQIDDTGNQVSPQELKSSPLFQKFDFPKHNLKAYHGSLVKLLKHCINDQSDSDLKPCIDLAWLESSSEAERAASRKAWQVVPEGSIPWDSIDISSIPIDTPKLPDLNSVLPQVDLTDVLPLAPLEKFLIDGISIDNIPIDRLPLDKLDLDQLIPEIPIQKPDLKSFMK